MPIDTAEKNRFDMKAVIKTATENINKKDPANQYKPDEVKKMISERIEKLMLRPGGITPPEAGAAIANVFGTAPLHFSFDRNRPFTQEEMETYNAIGLTGAAMVKRLGMIRMNERKKAKAVWDEARRNDVAIFRQYFTAYLQEEHGEHKENKLGVKVAVGDVVTIERGHYKRLY